MEIYHKTIMTESGACEIDDAIDKALRTLKGEHGPVRLVNTSMVLGDVAWITVIAEQVKEEILPVPQPSTSTTFDETYKRMQSQPWGNFRETFV